MNDHTHTDKTLQGNNKIESAIAALQQEPYSNCHPPAYE